MIDAHCHLNFHKFEEDVEEVIRHAAEAGITKIINTGTSLPSSRKAIELAENYNNLFAIVGIHPHHADKVLSRHSRAGGNPSEISDQVRDDMFESEDDMVDWKEKLEEMLSHPKVVGVGEIGMDYFYYQSNGIVEKKLQEDVFVAQIELAHKYHKPLQIHNRLAGSDTIAILKRNKHLLQQDHPGMFHCFAGDFEFLKNALDLGFYIGFDGNITYPGLAPKETVKLSDLAKEVPLDRLVTETDSPFLSPIPFRGSRNEPKNVILV